MFLVDKIVNIPPQFIRHDIGETLEITWTYMTHQTKLYILFWKYISRRQNSEHSTSIHKGWHRRNFRNNMDKVDRDV